MSERDARGPEDITMSATEWRGPSENHRVQAGIGSRYAL